MRASSVGDQVPNLTAMDALKRWENAKQQI